MNAKCIIAAIAALFAACLLAALCAHAAKPPEQSAATPDAAWDALFTRTNGWTGGDVAATVDLMDGRILWLFGDSWIGDVADGKHVAGSKMVNNSIAIQSLAARRGVPPAAGATQFYWQSDKGNPRAWIVPDRARGDKSASWYWPAGGGIIVPGPGGRPRLIVFLFHIGKREGQAGVWAFKSLGCAMAIVDNMADKAERWRAKQFDIPFAIGADAVASAAKKGSQRRQTDWGIAAARDDEAAGHGWLYIYGVRNESPLNRQLLLARAKIEAPQEFDAWQFYAGDGKWSAASNDAKPIAEGVAAELSVERLPAGETIAAGPRPKWIMVHSESPLGRKIFVRTASRPEGPWSERKAVYSVPEVDRNRSYFAYAAKGHLALSRPGELLITYVVNASDFAAMVHDANIYRPRFIRVPLPIAK